MSLPLHFGSPLLDAEGHPLCPLARAEARMYELLEEAIYGECGSPEGRVALLRSIVLGESEPRPTITGLAAAVPP